MFKCLKFCKLCSRVVMFINRIYLWFLQRILKITLCEILWFIVLFFVILWCWTNDQNCEVEVHSEHPIILWWTDGFHGSSDTKNCPDGIQCTVYTDRNISNIYKIDAYLFYGSNINFDDLPLPRNPKDTIWGLFHEESPRNLEELMHDPILKLFNFSSTYSRYSDVPFPLQHLDSIYDITSRKHFFETYLKNSFLKDIAPILYLQSDCETSTERDLYVKELMEYIDVDSYGTCLNNKELPSKFTQDYLNNLNGDEFLNFVARYKFVIAIENGVCNDYVTEKFWRAIKVGTIPIYFGSPSISHWLPNPKSAILLQDFPTPKLLSEFLKQLLNHDELYEEYLDHKIKQTIMNKRLIEESQSRPYQFDSLNSVDKFQCYVCEKLYEGIKGNQDINIVNSKHYDCSKPISALQQTVNDKNSWVSSWEYKRKKSKEIYDKIMNV